jgi:predicted dehydrogenase
MGERHARTYAMLPDSELVGVFDPDRSRAAAVAEQYGGKAFPSLEQLLAEVDAVSIASPTSTHAVTASLGLRAGRHLLIEKPLAGSLSEAEELARLAGDAPNLVLLVGHVERFNPMVRELMRVIDGKKIARLRFRRMSPFGNRCLDSDVIHDLMIHDIDLVISLFKSEIASIDASGSAVMTDHIDEAMADLVLTDNTRVTLIASRVANQRARDIGVTFDGGFVAADLLEHTISITHGSNATGRCLTDVRRINPQETLRSELQHFLRCIRGEEAPLIDVHAGLRAMEWAARVQAHIGRADDLMNSTAITTAAAG